MTRSLNLSISCTSDAPLTYSKTLPQTPYTCTENPHENRHHRLTFRHRGNRPKFAHASQLSDEQQCAKLHERNPATTTTARHSPNLPTGISSRASHRKRRCQSPCESLDQKVLQDSPRRSVVVYLIRDRIPGRNLPRLGYFSWVNCGLIIENPHSFNDSMTRSLNLSIPTSSLRAAPRQYCRGSYSSPDTSSRRPAG